jgi:hypothetical protein
LLVSTISLGVNGRDGILRNIRIEPYDSYAQLVHHVRQKINDMNTNLELSYSLAWLAKGGPRHALECEADWEELVNVILANTCKLPASHHAYLHHFLDHEAEHQAGSKGKGKKKTASETENTVRYEFL